MRRTNTFTAYVHLLYSPKPFIWSFEMHYCLPLSLCRTRQTYAPCSQQGYIGANIFPKIGQVHHVPYHHTCIPHALVHLRGGGETKNDNSCKTAGLESCIPRQQFSEPVGNRSVPREPLLMSSPFPESQRLRWAEDYGGYGWAK